MKKVSKITNVISIIIMACYALWLITVWDKAPERVPIHFNVSGEADGWGTKYFLIAEFFITLVSFLGLAVVERFPKLWNIPVKITEENREKVYKITGITLSVIKVLLVLLLFYAATTGVYPNHSILPVLILTGMILLTSLAGIIAMIFSK